MGRVGGGRVLPRGPAGRGRGVVMLVLVVAVFGLRPGLGLRPKPGVAADGEGVSGGVFVMLSPRCVYAESRSYVVYVGLSE